MRDLKWACAAAILVGAIAPAGAQAASKVVLKTPLVGMTNRERI